MRVPDQTEGPGVRLDSAQLGEEGDRGVRIELRDVWFKYPTRDVPVLNGLNITVSIDHQSPLPDRTNDFRLRKDSLRP